MFKYDHLDPVHPQSEPVVLAELRGAVLVLTLNRPERLNAWTDELEERYFALLEQAEDDEDVRAIVLTGSGRGFCAGADMDELHKAVDGEAASRGDARPRSFPWTVRKPMIAAINGPAAGLGLVEALYCDVRFTTPDAKLTTSFARRGLIAEYGCSWLLGRLVGQGAALDLLMSGRVVRGEEALGMGLVDRLVAPDRVLDAAVAYAHDIARSSSPTSVAVIKDQVRADLDRTFEQACAAADEQMIASFTRADAGEGVRSYAEKRDPAFPPLSPR